MVPSRCHLSIISPPCQHRINLGHPRHSKAGGSFRGFGEAISIDVLAGWAGGPGLLGGKPPRRGCVSYPRRALSANCESKYGQEWPIPVLWRRPFLFSILFFPLNA